MRNRRKELDGSRVLKAYPTLRSWIRCCLLAFPHCLCRAWAPSFEFPLCWSCLDHVLYAGNLDAKRTMDLILLLCRGPLYAFSGGHAANSRLSSIGFANVKEHLRLASSDQHSRFRLCFDRFIKICNQYHWSQYFGTWQVLLCPVLWKSWPVPAVNAIFSTPSTLEEKSNLLSSGWLCVVRGPCDADPCLQGPGKGMVYI